MTNRRFTRERGALQRPRDVQWYTIRYWGRTVPPAGERAN